MNLIKTLEIAVKNKPAFGSPCNHCGYCCLTEVCVVGQELTGKEFGPCELLISDGEKHTCKLSDDAAFKEILGLSTGCCSETQAEAIARLTSQ